MESLPGSEDSEDLRLVRMRVPPAVKAAFDETHELYMAVQGHEASVAAFVEALIAEPYAGPDAPDVELDRIVKRSNPAAVEEALAHEAGHWRHLDEWCEQCRSWEAAVGTENGNTAGIGDTNVVTVDPAGRAAGDRAENGNYAVQGAKIAMGALVDASEREPKASECELGADDGPQSVCGGAEGSRHDDDVESHLTEAQMTLLRAREVCEEAGTGDFEALDHQLRILVFLEDEIECRLGQLLASMSEHRAWEVLRFAGVGHYGEQRLGVSRTAAGARAFLARSVKRHRALREAYEGGRIGLETTLLPRRVFALNPETMKAEEEWVRHGEQVTIRRLRDEVAWMSRAMVEEPASVGSSPPSDAVWKKSLGRAPGSFRERVRRFSGMTSHAAPPEYRGGDITKPDVFLRIHLERDLAEQFLGVIEWRRKELSDWVDGWRAVGTSKPEAPRNETCRGEHWKGEDSESEACEGESSQTSWSTIRVLKWSDPEAPGSGAARAALTFSERKARVPDWVGLLSLLEDFAETWDDPASFPRRASGAIYIRDGWRCTAPGCSSRRNFEDHHVVYRSRRGGNELANRTCLCRFHHRQGEHGLFARCTGTAPLHLRWVMGRGGCGGVFRNDRRLE